MEFVPLALATLAHFELLSLALGTSAHFELLSLARYDLAVRDGEPTNLDLVLVEPPMQSRCKLIVIADVQQVFDVEKFHDVFVSVLILTTAED